MEINLSVSDEMLINSFNKYSVKIQLNKVATSVELMEVENKFYLKFNNTDESASKVALIEKNPEGSNFNVSSERVSFINVGATVCTSEGCAHCCGCLPDGDYCTKCDRWQRDDCKRTTSN